MTKNNHTQNPSTSPHLCADTSDNALCRNCLAMTQKILPLIAIILALLAGNAYAQSTTFWDNPDTGKWENVSNWNFGVPNGGVHARIDNGGTAIVDDDTGGATSQYLTVGFTQTGYLMIRNGGILTPTDVIFIGHTNAGIGTITVEGSGSQLLGSSFLNVGYDGTGFLHIMGGGKATGGIINLGDQATGTGTATVDGATSLLQSTGNLYVGNSGTGFLNITNGGSATSAGEIRIGNSLGSRGTVSVSGSGSVLENTSGFLYVGYNGMGILNITDGGRVTSASSIDISNGSIVTVDGLNSLLENKASFLYVGSNGTGILNLTNGAAATSVSDIFLGQNGGIHGIVTVDGSSTLTSGRDIRIGNAGSGVLNLTNGGKATATGDIVLGRTGVGEGTALVGFGSELISTGGSVNVGNGVGASGFLAGSGTVKAADVVVSSTGTLSPGDAWGDIGTLNIVGNLDMQDNSAIHIDFNSTTNDLVHVTGGADFGGELNLSVSSLANINTQLSGKTILVAEGGITGLGAGGTIPQKGFVLLNGLSLNSSNRLDGGTGTRYVDYHNPGSANELAISFSGLPLTAINTTLTWRNAGGMNNLWDISSTNWTGDTSNQFLDGDAVTFNNSAATTITIEGTQKTVAQMTVSGTGDLTINGNILGDSTLSTLDGTSGILGGLRKTGTGSLTLNGRSRFVGNIDLQDGITNIGSGSELRSESNVNVDGTLAGGGKVIGKNVIVNSGGVLAPSDTLSIVGNLNMQSGSTLVIGINNTAGTNDVLAVSGVITITPGAKLDVNVIGTGLDQRFRVLEGTFANGTLFDLTGMTTGLNQRFFGGGYWLYYGDWGAQEFAKAIGPYASSNAFRAAVGVDTLEELGLTGGILDLFDALSNLGGDPRGLAAAFAQLHGEVFSAGKQNMVKMQKSFLWQLPGVLDRYTGSNDGIYRGQCDPCERAAGISPPVNGNWNRWASFTGDWFERKSVGTASGYDLRSAGVAVGMDTKLSRNSFAGFAFAYDNAYQNFKSIQSSNQIDAFRAALYGGVRNGNTYADGYAGYTKSWNKTRRDINIGSFSGIARSKFDDDMFSTGFEIGRKLAFGSGRLTPSIGLHYIHLSSPSVTESGAGDANLVIQSQSYNSLRLPIGARLSRNTWGGSVMWTPEVRAFYIREMADASVRTSTAFAGEAGVPFYAESGNWGRNSGRFGVGLNAKLSDWLNFRVDYDYEVYDHTAASELGATLGVKW